LYRSGHQDFPDNAERFAMLSLACLEFAKRSPFPPDIIHCHDWQAALVPVYLKTRYQEDPFFRKTRTLLTIHNLAFQGVFPRTVLPQVSLPDSLYHVDRMEFYSHVNFLKGGILLADEISTVSRKYSLEIQTAEFGCGLEGVLASRSNSLAGILNGVDYSEWNPETDLLIPARYSMDDPAGKGQCKATLLAQFGLEESLERPLVGMISRLTDQKGLDLLVESADAILQMGCSLVVLGRGEEKYHRFFTALQQRFPRQVSVQLAYDNTLAHKIEAGADIFLMPSRFEPCGLNQIYSLKYGTVPVVRAIGGLDDTIEDYTGPEGGTGFKFEAYSAASLLEAVRRSVDVFQNSEQWQKLMRRGMSKDFSWGRSARQYIELYDSLILH
jgi:starch synthase